MTRGDDNLWCRVGGGAVRQGLALLTLSWDKNWDSHSLVNGYPSFYPRIALVAPSPGDALFSVMVIFNMLFLYKYFVSGCNKEFIIFIFIFMTADELATSGSRAIQLGSMRKDTPWWHIYTISHEICLNVYFVLFWFWKQHLENSLGSFILSIDEFPLAMEVQRWIFYLLNDHEGYGFNWVVLIAWWVTMNTYEIAVLHTTGISHRLSGQCARNNSANPIYIYLLMTFSKSGSFY